MFNDEILQICIFKSSIDLMDISPEDGENSIWGELQITFEVIDDLYTSKNYNANIQGLNLIAKRYIYLFYFELKESGHQSDIFTLLIYASRRLAEIAQTRMEITGEKTINQSLKTCIESITRTWAFISDHKESFKIKLDEKNSL